MKLLTWMHRKLRNSNHENFIEFQHGQTVFNSQPLQKPTTSNGNGREGRKDPQARISFTSLQDTRLRDLDMEPLNCQSESFHGFLTIGTLGGDTFISEPETPTFVFSIESITERGTEVTEPDLKVINDELEKVLGSEVKDDICTDSSGRNSHVSNGRSSHASTITLSGRALENSEGNGNEKPNCPLQGYLSGAAFEYPEKMTGAKKEHRASLRELFEKHKLEKKQTEKSDDKSGINLMRKILKGKVAHAPRRFSLTKGGTRESTAAETKLHKMLHIFHKKVHPEDLTMHSLGTPQQYRSKNNSISSRGGKLRDKEVRKTVQPQRISKKRQECCYRRKSNSSDSSAACSDSNGSRECWIKTDANYHVLEL